MVVDDTGIDVTGTVVADGLRVDTSATGGFKVEDRGSSGTKITSYQGTNNSNVRQLDLNAYKVAIRTGEVTGTAVTDRLLVSNNGDISFYNDSAAQGLFWDSSTSRLGLGVTNPSNKLHIRGSAITGATSDVNSTLYLEQNANNSIQINSGATNNGQIRFGDASSSYRGAITYAHSNDSLSFVSAGQQRLTINADGSSVFSGSVGIGTSSPANLLHVKGVSSGVLELARFRLEGATNNPMLKIEADEANQTAGIDVSGSTATELTFSQGGAERMRIDSSGRVGIGTSSPSYKLDIFNNTTNTGSQLRVKNSYVSASADSVINIDGYGASTLKIWRNGVEEWKLDRPAGSDNLGLYAYGAAVNDGAGAGLVQSWDYDTGNVNIPNGSLMVGSTTAPSYKLDVAGTLHAKVGSSAMLFDEYSNGATLFLDGSNGDFSGADYFNISAYGTTDLAFGYGTVTKMTLKNTGSVGIGTSSNLTNGTLNVESNGTSVLQARSDAAGTNDGDTTVVVSRAVNSTASKWSNAIYRGYSHAWSYGSGAATTEAMRINSSGNVGFNVDPTTSKFRVTHSGVTQLILGYAGGTTNYYDGNLQIFRSSGGTERMRLTSTGLGIGNTSPDSVLTAVNAASTAALRIGLNNTSYNYMDADNNIFRNGAGTERMRIDSSGALLLHPNNATRGLKITSTTTGTAGDTTTYDTVAAGYGRHVFKTDGAERTRIASNGTLYHGKTADSLNTGGLQTLISGQTSITQDHNEPLRLNRMSSQGAIQKFYYNGGEVGSIGTKSGDLAIGTGDTGVRFDDANNAIYAHSMSANAYLDATVDLGYSGIRFKDLYLSNGIQGTSTMYWSIPHTSGGALRLEFGNYNNTARRTVQFYKDNVEPLASYTDLISLGQSTNRFKDLYLSNNATAQKLTLTKAPVGLFTIEVDGTNTGQPNLIVKKSTSEALRIDNNNNLLVGTTSTDLVNNNGIVAASAGYLDVSRNDLVARFTRRLTDGTILDFRKDGTTVGSIGAKGGTAYLIGSSKGLRVSGSGLIPITTAGANSDATYDIGDPSVRFKDLYLSGSVIGGGAIQSYAGTAGAAAFRPNNDLNTGIFFPSADTFAVTTGGSEAYRVDSFGNLMVGKSSLDFGATSGQEFRADGRVFIGHSGAGHFVNRIGSSGAISEFRKDGTTVGSIGTLNSDLTIGSGDTGLRFNSANDFILPFNTTTNASRDAAIDLGLSTTRFKDLYLSGKIYGSTLGIGDAGIQADQYSNAVKPFRPDITSGTSDNYLDLGTSSDRWKDLYLSSGVYLGGTGAANKLDDYEVGSWTPSLVGSTTAGTATFVSGPTGTYTKIGNQVTVYFDWNISAHTGTGALRVNGLPFTKGSGPAVGAVMDGNYSYTSGRTRLVPYVVGSVLRFYGVGDGVGYAENVLDVTHQMNGSVTYTV
jgi:hypothetical protein